jgi:hypothetical protein
MKNTEQHREISPDHWLTPPVNYQLDPPQHVIDANELAAQAMNKAKFTFVSQCLGVIMTDQEVGEAELSHLGDTTAQATALLAKIDPGRIRLTLRPLYDRPLLNPEEATLDGDKEIVRHYGDDLELAYDDRPIGFLKFRYTAGRIEISCNIDTEIQ